MGKGRDAEKALLERYQAAGYQCYLPPLAKYREQDVFGLFDILAFGHDRLEAVQVKAQRDAAGIKGWFDQARVFEAHIDGLRIGFGHKTGEGWRFARTAADGYQWVFDGRPDCSIGPDGLEEVLIE